MKRAVKVFLILIFLCAFCSGCNSWMNGEYLSVTPHQAQPEPYTNRVIEVTSYTQLRNAITTLVRNGAENGIISISAFNKGTIHFYLDTAIANVIENTAFGAYAVEKITYEIGTNRGVSVVACKIHYRSGSMLPTQITHVENADALASLIVHTLDEQDNLLLAYMEQYEKLDIEGTIANYAMQYPERVIEVPRVTVTRYPDKGVERIIQISLEYKNSGIQMHQMRSKVEEAFAAARQYADDAAGEEDVYFKLYTYLMETAQYREEATTMPAYEVLVNGAGDSAAFAIVYARMCNKVGLDCKVISGEREGEAWTWNVVSYRGRDYHIDLLSCYDKQTFQMYRVEQMSSYSWGDEY